MVRALELECQKFNRLLVISRAESTDKGLSRWNCICDCGNSIVVKGTLLSNGSTKSCGCLSRERIGALNRSHGLTGSPEHQSWRGMKARCDNPKSSHYQIYGGRGIRYDESWLDFSVFLHDMGQRPEGTQLDRKDVNGGYNKHNCKWADLTQQAYNTRKKPRNRSGRTGVFQRESGKFTAVITHYKVVKYLGTFETFDAACAAREKAESILYGIVKE